MENNKPYLSNKDYKKLSKQRIKLNNKKQNKNIKNEQKKEYIEDKPIIYNIYNNYHIYSGMHKWLIRE